MAIRFMETLTQRLVDEKNIKPITAKNVVNHLRMVASGPFESLTFLSNKDAVDLRLKDYAESSQRTLVGSIVGVLRIFKSPTYKGLLKHYNDKFLVLRKAKEDGKTEIKEMTEKEKSCWMTWPQITARHAKLAEEVKALEKPSARWTADDHRDYLEYTALSLYVLIPPGRNGNYQKMVAVKDPKTAFEAKEGNYYLPKTRQFVFNDYKTAKKFGQQVSTVPVELATILNLLLKKSKIGRETKGRWKEAPLLVDSDGDGLEAQNALTRVLNGALGQRCGCNMLRHSYVTHKYGATAAEMVEDAAAMGHSVATQIGEYIRKEPDEITLTFD